MSPTYEPPPEDCLTGEFTTHHPGRPHKIVRAGATWWLCFRHPDGQWVTEQAVVVNALTRGCGASHPRGRDLRTRIDSYLSSTPGAAKGEEVAEQRCVKCGGYGRASPCKYCAMKCADCGKGAGAHCPDFPKCDCRCGGDHK